MFLVSTAVTSLLLIIYAIYKYATSKTDAGAAAVRDEEKRGPTYVNEGLHKAPAA